MKHYWVRFLAHSNKFNEDYICEQSTKDLVKFCKSHKVISAYECTLGKYSRLEHLGKKVI